MVAEGPSRAVFRFDRFILDVGLGALLSDDGGELALRPKSFALLQYLLEHAGRAIGRAELMAAVWPGLHVTEDSVAQCVVDIRRTLGDDGLKLLRTVPRRGYLFAAPVCRAETASVPAAVARPAFASAAAGDEAVPHPPSGRPMVVVQPFRDLADGTTHDGFFADGLTADLVNDLTRFQALHVVAPPRTADGVRPLPAAVTYAVIGAVRRGGGRVRVTARLEDARTGVQLWADRIDRPLDDLFVVQEELAEQLAAQLIAQIGRDGLRRARRQPPANLNAYDLCLRGRELHNRTTEADTLLAREMFARAIASDPAYADAHAWQAFTVQRGFSYWWGEPRGRAALPLALELAQRAVEIEPDSPRCVAILGYVLMLCGRWDEALDTARTAIRLNPGAPYGRASYGEVLIHGGGNPEHAVRETRLALSLDPFQPPRLRHQLGRALLLVGRAEEALMELRPLAARLPDFAPCYHTLVTAAVEAGHLEEARAAVREVRRLGPHWTLRTIDSLWNFRRAADADRFRSAYRAAGLPES